MIKLSKPYFPPEALENVLKVLASGNLVQGEFVLKFEEKLKDYLGVKNVIVVSNGTAALHLSLIVLGIGPGDEVIVPAFTFPATANVVELVGAKPVFVDIGLDDFCIDTRKIEKVITSRTKAIIPVHEFGQSAGMTEIMRIAAQYHLLIVEDAACALGTEFAYKKVGTFGELGCFSFHPRKAITTGEGGAIVTNDDCMAAKLRTLRNHGIEMVDGKIDFTSAGLNYRMTDFQAALGFYQMLDINNYLRERIVIAADYTRRLNGIPGLKTPAIFSDRTNVYQTYHIIIDRQFNRDEIKRKLYEQGIETNYGANALPLLKFYKEKYLLNAEDFPDAVTAYRQGLALPLSHYIQEHEIIEVCERVKALIQ